MRKNSLHSFDQVSGRWRGSDRHLSMEGRMRKKNGGRRVEGVI